MTREDIKKELGFLFDEKITKQIVFFSYNPTSGVKRLNINAELMDLMLADFTDSIEDKMVKAEYDIQDFSVADRRSDSYYRYDLEERPNGFDIFVSVLRPDIPVFSFEDDSIRDIKKILVVISSGDERVILYKDVFEIEKYLAQGSFLISKHNDRFDRVPNDVLKINTDFQIIKLKDDIVGLTLKCFEKNFKLDHVLKKEAEKGVAIVDNLVSDSGFLKGWVQSDPGIRKQLISVKSSPVFTLLDEDGNRCVLDKDVIDYITKNKDVCGTFEISGNKVKIEHKTTAKRFLKVLNDDYFKSGLTSIVYETLSKKPDEN